jgi:polysaccharide export outer membrane protein
LKGVALAMVTLALGLLAGCGHDGGWKRPAAGEMPLGRSEIPLLEHEYVLAVGDGILLDVSYHDNFDTKAVVRPDGKVTFPLVGEVMAAGYTPSQLDSLVTRKLAEVIIDPDVSIIVESYSDQLVYVLGEVDRPGAYEVQRGMTATQAITQAGGPTPIAKLTDVVLIRRETPYKASGAKLDLESFLKNGDFRADAYLQAYDIVYVPRTKIGALSVWLDNFFKGWTQPLSLIVRGYDLILIARRTRD